MTMTPERAFSNVLPELADAEVLLRKNAAAHGITYAIADFGALRTQADTTKILGYRDADYAVYLRGLAPGATPVAKESWRPIAPFGTSYHNYGAAFDIVITAFPSNISTAARALDVLKLAAPTVGLRSNVPNDPGHFELPITLSDAKARWALYSGTSNAGSSSVGVILGLAAIATLVVIGIRHHRGGA